MIIGFHLDVFFLSPEKRNMSTENAARNTLLDSLFSTIENHRNSYGRNVNVALGSRGVFRHNADLELSEEEEDAAKVIYGLTEDHLYDRGYRHHPFLLMVAIKNDFEIQPLRLLPGETYKIYQDGDDEVAVVVRGHLLTFVADERIGKFIAYFKCSDAVKGKITELFT